MLPELIEIVPLDKPVRAEITVPGSKSITNRALILAALADGETTLQGALWSEDTQVMADCLGKLGFEVTMKPDPDEFCNRTITVKGLGGKIPKGGTAEKPLELFVGNAGTAARFLSAMVCLGNGVYRLHGVPRMHERPQAALFKALKELGYRIESENDKLPARIFGTGPKAGECTVSIEKSSQFASALLLCAEIGQWKVTVVGENAEESPYVAMTTKMIEAFPENGGMYQVEPDASSGSYFLAAGWILANDQQADLMASLMEKLMEKRELEAREELKKRRFKTIVQVTNWPESGLQIDEDFSVFVYPGVQGVAEDISRKTDLGDSIMTAIIAAAAQRKERPAGYRFVDLGRLRLQETERVVALRTELTKCGAKVVEEGDTLTVYPSELHGAEIETYNDHRMAMCFAILGLKVPGIKIKNPACVKKTFPNFFQKLAAAPPHGLGAIIRDAKTGLKLEVEELFAD